MSSSLSKQNLSGKCYIVQNELRQGQIVRNTARFTIKKKKKKTIIKMLSF